MLNDKSILITGGTGSFGKKATKIILNKYKPKRLIIFSRDELKQFEMSQIFPFSEYECIRYFIGDVRDKERLYRNIINVAIDQGVKRVVALSTDKAANPINLYGATKLCSDKLFIAGNAYVGREQTTFGVVRYGNVVGSRGSVIPFFLKQKENGILPITDPRMTRFWITLEQGVEFVLWCLEHMCGGELFVPKIPSMNILDLAKAIAPECETKIVGIRPGEKLHELMITRDDSRQTLEFDTFYVIQPDFQFWDRRCSWNGGDSVPEQFEYSSESNPWRLSIEEMRELIRKL
jgi:UDP-N-acetylglucosamine 4,6-dehydratase